MSRMSSIVLAVLASIVVSCAGRAPAPKKEPEPPVAARHMPMPPEKIRQLLESGRVELISTERAPGGVMGVAHAVVRFPDVGATFEVKWKQAPEGADGWNNTPRKELAAYDVQQWFVDERDYVVPPAAMRCIALDAYRRTFPGATANLPDAGCVLGLLTIWLEDVEVPKVLYDEARFERDREYARQIANLNILLYLIDHRDARANNILVSSDPQRFRVFSVDNGISFGSLVYNYFKGHWNVIRVPALPRTSVGRLRAVDHAALDALGVVAELHADGEGVYRTVPLHAPLDRDTGVRLKPGHLQLGLTREEIKGVRERLRALLKRVDAGEIPLF